MGSKAWGNMGRFAWMVRKLLQIENIYLVSSLSNQWNQVRIVI